MINLPAISQRIEEPIRDIEVVIKNRDLRIFRIGSLKATPEILQVLTKLLPLYGITEPNEEHLLEASIFISSYKLIAVDEIKLAFEKFARQELNIDDHKLYGKVDLAAIGRILTAYINWRQKIYHAIDCDNERINDKIRQKDKENKAVKDFYDQFPTMLQEFKGESWKDVPVYWYDACINAGLLSYMEGEKRKIWEEAQEISAKIKPEADNYFDLKSNLKNAAQIQDTNAKTIAQKLAVWKKVLNRK